MLAALVGVVSELGAANVTVAHVVGRSGVSRRTFYEIFDDREDCFLAAFDDAVERVARDVVPAYESATGWRERVRAGLVASLSVLDSEPGLARLLVVESLAAGTRALEKRKRVLDRLVATVDEARSPTTTSSRTEPPPLTAEGVVGGVLAVLHARLLDRNAGSLLELTNPLMGMIVLPYLGLAAARRELERPLPKTPARVRHAAGDPLRDLQMRLTYRTVRVLMAVAASPGSSNRTIAEGAGIADQGQISKLLARLHNLGLIENVSAGAARGGPNAWTLTDKGWEVHGAIAHQASGA
jgi:AcrR family transcriptional regulator